MRRSRVTRETARSMAVATIRTVRWIVVELARQSRAQNGDGSRYGKCPEVGQFAQIFQPSPDISIEDYPPSLRQHHRVMSTIPTPRERKLADTSSLAVWDISSDPVRYQINTRVSRRITPPPPTPPPPTPPRSD